MPIGVEPAERERGSHVRVWAPTHARVTFVDIVESNLQVMARLCRVFSVTNAGFLYLQNLQSLDALADDFDVIWCQGSMINAPFQFAARESAALLQHLKPGGRWIELAYPRERWERDGRPPFSVWGTMTDSVGTGTAIVLTAGSSAAFSTFAGSTTFTGASATFWTGSSR